MKNYKITVKLRVESVRDSYGNPDVIGECDLSKIALLPAVKVKDEATKLVRNAVAHFSESVALGLAPVIAQEPKLGDSDVQELTV